MPANRVWAKAIPIRLRWLFNIYRVAYGKPKHGPPEPQWLVTVCGRRFVVRYCATAEAAW